MADYVGVVEMAEMLGVSPWTVRDWVRLGAIPAHRPGGPRGRLLFDPTEVDQAIKGGRPRQPVVVEAAAR
jgi:excisionase family DNA binding protein